MSQNLLKSTSAKIEDSSDDVAGGGSGGAAASIPAAASSSSSSSKFQSRVLIERVVILNVIKAPMGALVTSTTVKEQTSRSETPEERLDGGNVIHSRSTVAVMTRYGVIFFYLHDRCVI